MLVGYLRVSSDSDRQSTDLQRDALLAAGVDARHLFQDQASKAAVCRTFAIPRSTLNDTLTRAGWSGHRA